MRSYSDPEINALIRSVREGSDEAFAELTRLYMPMLTASAEDICHGKLPFAEALAEAQIALHNAALGYRTEQSGVSFGLYAKICVCRRLASAVRREQSLTNSLDTLDDEAVAVPDGIEAALLRDEAYAALLRRIRALLSAYEYRVFLLLCVHGYSVSLAAEMLGRDEKSVGNARDRLFQKLRAHKELLHEEND
ncbi:MAG TPA: hypothetical protein DDY70_01300 [Clostridiales bacterium]|nr:hypothetical protein [Clostridiales bacterium]